MKSEATKLRIACLLAMLVLLLPMPGTAQTPSGGQGAPAETKIGEYIISQSLEFGYRYTDVRGAKVPCTTSAAGVCQDESMYNTFVNLHTGPRLLEQTLSLRSPGHSGVLFDDLYLNSFGWGGDPNNVARLRLKKNKAYNLVVNFRRDQNFFSYNLLANPLNPGTLNPSAAVFFAPVTPSLTPGLAANTFLVSNSPHWFSSTRRMTDVDLTIAPQSVISLRLGYSRVRTEGLYGWTYHMSHGTDINPTTNQDNTSDFYRLGLDFRFLPKTTISYDQFYTHNRVGISGTDRNLFFNVAGVPTDFGISWNVAANQPCAAASVLTSRCNQATSFLLVNNYRTSTPTEQLSLQSHPSKRFDVSGRFAYSHSHEDGNWFQTWTGLAGTPGAASTVGNGLLLSSISHNKRDEGAADFGLTIHLTDRLRLVDDFRWYNWRIPTFGFLSGSAFNPGTASKPVTSSLAFTAVAPTGITGCSTFPCLFPQFWKEARTENAVELEYDITHMVGVRVGYRYSDRFIFDRDEIIPATAEGGAAAGDIETGQDRASITGNSGLFGVWVRKGQKFRASFDGEITKNRQVTGGGDTGIPPDTTFGLGPLTRITPRHEQQFRLRASYTPKPWMVVSASGNILQESNHLATDDYNMHNWSGGFGVMLMPNDKYTFDLSYNYNSYQQNNFICPIGLVPGVPIGSTVLNTVCPYDINPTPPPLFTGLYQTFGRFESINNFFSALLRAKLVPRVTASVGYSISSNDGAQVYTNTLFVPGSLKNSFHRPLASLEVGLVKNWTAIAGWNYYDYNEKAAAGQSLPRDFHANTATLSVRYAF
jgi:opacity protein-like surface antigen